MTEHDAAQTPAEQAAEQSEPKKVSLAEAMKQKLAQKKAEQANHNRQQKGGFQPDGTPVMKSQNTKKINNQRKRMGV